MRTKYNKRRFKTFIMIIIILFCMSIGYSYLLTNLNIEGTTSIKGNTWDVHWENINVNSGSVTGDQVPIAAHILSDTTQVEYSVILKNPGDYYEFTVDAKNSGTIDAMVDIINTAYYESNGVTQISLPNYLECSFTYEDGIQIHPNQILEAGQKEKLKVKIKFKDNLEESELPTTDKTIVIRHNITYVQSDETAIPTRTYSYEGTDGATFQSPEATMNASGYPLFIRNIISENEIIASDLGFQYNGNIYYLKGKINEQNLSTKPVYEANKATLLEAFGSDKCLVDNQIMPPYMQTRCTDDNIQVTIFAYTDGLVGSYKGDYNCEVGETNTECYTAIIG